MSNYGVDSAAQWREVKNCLHMDLKTLSAACASSLHACHTASMLVALDDVGFVARMHFACRCVLLLQVVHCQ
jgi:hypothetical protein